MSHASVPAPYPVALLTLAAGGSTRLGRPKQLLEYHGRPLLRHSVEQALDSRCRPVIVVLGADATACRATLRDLAVQVRVNEDWELGMGSSIRSGMAALQEQAPDVQAVVITLCDQPLVTPALLDQLVRLHMEHDAPMVAASYDDQPGVPALFARSLFPLLAAIDVNAGAKALLRHGGSELLTIPFAHAEVDIDTPDDYDRLLHGLHGPQR
jgi:molybdenum cofactor cytidylyltransferase